MQNEEAFEMVATLVRIRREGKITDIDLYNSILRLIYNSDDWDYEYLKKIIDFQDKYEDEDTSRPENYVLLAHSAGAAYLRGITALI